jgi:hypothetical protein
VGLSRLISKTQSLNASFEGFDRALSSGKLPGTGKVNDRLVRSAFSALERLNPKVRVADVPNPFHDPFNLNWYFGLCACPDEVRAFATTIGRKSIRVWSVAEHGGAWKVLAQVFGDPAALVPAADAAQKRLNKFHVSSVQPTQYRPANVNAFAHEFTRGLLQKQDGTGQFIEVHLRRG